MTDRQFRILCQLLYFGFHLINASFLKSTSHVIVNSDQMTKIISELP